MLGIAAHPESAASADAANPLGPVLALDKRPGPGLGATLVAAGALQAGIWACAVFWSEFGLAQFGRDVEQIVAERLTDIYELEPLKEEAPPPPPPPEPPKDEPPAPPTPRTVPEAPAAAPPPAAAAAQAGKILAQDPDPNEPVDLTGFHTGSAEDYAGGSTLPTGTASAAVTANVVRPDGVPGGTGRAPAPPPPPAPDRSKPAGLLGSSEWSCPWPAEADTADMNEATVVLQVSVRADGVPASSRVLSDPGYGFGREAVRCAMSKRYAPALDREGNPTAGTTSRFRVHFER